MRSAGRFAVRSADSFRSLPEGGLPRLLLGAPPPPSPARPSRLLVCSIGVNPGLAALPVPPPPAEPGLLFLPWPPPPMPGMVRMDGMLSPTDGVPRDPSRDDGREEAEEPPRIPADREEDEPPILKHSPGTNCGSCWGGAKEPGGANNCVPRSNGDAWVVGDVWAVGGPGSRGALADALVIFALALREASFSWGDDRCCNRCTPSFWDALLDPVCERWLRL